VEPGDAPSAVSALDRLLADAGLRERLGRNAAALAGELTWAQNARNVSTVFETAH
jgi:glycosyltransferase involved in cell wall biosynthesis